MSTKPEVIVGEVRDETPTDGYGAGFLEYSIRTSFRDLCALIGRESAEQEITEIVNGERDRKRWIEP
jgi:hypothetical protein